MEKILNDEYRLPIKTIDKNSLSNLEKIERAKYAAVLLDSAQEQIKKEEIRHLEDSKQTESKEERKKDIDSLIKSKERSVENLQTQKIEVWTEKQAFEAWSKILNWEPKSQDILETLRDLKQCYTHLLESLLNFESLENQPFALLGLQEALFQALNCVLEKNMSDLFQFLFLNSEKEAVTILVARLHELVTGEPVNFSVQQKIQTGKLQVDYAILNGENRKLLKHDFNVNNGNKSNTRLQLYKNHSEPELLFCYTPSGQKDKASLFSSDKISDVPFKQFAVKVEGSILKEKTFITESDFKNAIKFIKHLNQEIDSYSFLESVFDPETAMGIKMGILSLKWEVFYSNAHIGKDMTEILNTAINKFLFYSIQKESFLLKNKNYDLRESIRPFNQKEVFLISDTILEIYHKTKNPVEAVLKGVDFALKTFFEKTTNSFNQKDSQHPFLLKNLEIKLEHQQKELFQCIRENWNEFALSVSLNRKKGYFIEDYSKYQSIWLGGAKGGISFLNKDRGSISGFMMFAFLFFIIFIGAMVLFFGGNSQSSFFLLGCFSLGIFAGYYYLKYT